MQTIINKLLQSPLFRLVYWFIRAPFSCYAAFNESGIGLLLNIFQHTHEMEKLSIFEFVYQAFELSNRAGKPFMVYDRSKFIFNNGSPFSIAFFEERGWNNWLWMRSRKNIVE